MISRLFAFRNGWSHNSPESPKPHFSRGVVVEEDFGELDREEFAYFTGPARLTKAMSTLHGLMQGIVADGKVTDEELVTLTRWISLHSEYANRHPFNEVIPHLQQIVSDGKIDEEERADILWLAERVAKDSDYYDEITCDMQQLQGFLGGILADGIITEDELGALSAWIDEHEHLKSCWPYDELESIIAYVMKDGKMDAQEHEALLQFFGEFTRSASRKAVGAIDRESTVSGVCATCPEIEFPENLFCLTGTSERGPRTYVGEVIERCGGKFHNRIVDQTKYLVVGAKGNPCWAFACYGRKVEDAADRRRKGQQIVIVHEFDFWDAVADVGVE